VAYVGYAHNGNLASTPESWKKMLDPHNIEFRFLTEKNWHDLSSIDVLIGIRSFDHNKHNNKPPSKLINAWHAGIPFIGGHDSAFKQVGTPDEDYLLAGTQKEVVNAILKLRDEPELYEKLVRKGFKKAEEYTIEKVSQQWFDILVGPVTRRYMKWESRKSFEKIRFSTLSKIGKQQHNLHRLFKKIVHSFTFG
jgi:hypothetical protein